MKTCGKLVAIALFCGLVFGAAPAVAGEAGTVSCSTPDCGYQYDLKIGGGMKSPSLTGYCRSTKKFVRVKLRAGKVTGKLLRLAPIVRNRSCRFMMGARSPKFPVPNAAI